MKTKIKRHLSLIVITLIFGVISSSSALASAVSVDFELDFDTISTGSELYTSGNFELQSGLTAIETNSNSSNFQITTINNIPLCGDGVAQSIETCDGNDFKGQTCADFGFNSGYLTCSSDCSTLSIINCEFVGGGGTGLLIEPEEPEPPGPEPEPPGPEPPGPEPEPPADGTGGPEPEPEPPPSPPTPYIPPKIEEISTVDTTPLFVDLLEPDTDYTLTIRNEEGDVLVQKEVTTDEDGYYIYETEIDLDLGKYKITIVDPEEEKGKSYNLEVIEKEYREIDIKKFAELENPDVSFVEIIDLGDIEKREGQKIHGDTVPYATVYSYFVDGKLQIRERKADENGNFEIPIPDELELGDHMVYVVQIYPDEVMSKDIIYKFRLVEKEELERQRFEEAERLARCETTLRKFCLCRDSLIESPCLAIALYIFLIFTTLITRRKRK